MNFTATRRAGFYTTTLTTRTGREVEVKVSKTERGNPSARGGATRQVWAAKYAGVTAYGDTREQAVNSLIERKGAEGIVLTVPAN